VGERLDAATQAVEGLTNAAQNAEKEEKKNQLESVSLSIDVENKDFSTSIPSSWG
jgi:hypothetical protein